MNAYRIETAIAENGTLTLSGIPFHAGDTVEVIILERKMQVSPPSRYPLRGTPIHYIDPTEPVALEEWDIVQ
jgi:hypothetical protein